MTYRCTKLPPDGGAKDHYLAEFLQIRNVGTAELGHVGPHEVVVRMLTKAAVI